MKGADRVGYLSASKIKNLIKDENEKGGENEKENFVSE